MKASIICCDPPWAFNDKLKQSKTKRGAEANYSTMSIDEIKSLNISLISEDDSILALWCPSSLLQEGLDVIKAWGFKFKQTVIWVKTKQKPEKEKINNYNDLEKILAFGMGNIFRGTHEVCLIGTRGKISKKILNRSLRTVFFHPATKHSQKPETFQDMLEQLMTGNKIEIFARRDRVGWVCLGNECPSTKGEDIKDSLIKLQ
jgi:N6-adenosine-specific RNA methylase IME4